MLRLIPPRLHIAALRSVHGLRIRWWRLRRVRVTGCRVVALDGAGRVLLIRHSYGSRHWMLPGGGIKRGEHPLIAAARELHEETALVLSGAVEIGVVTEMAHGGGNDVRVVAGWTGDAPPRADGREILAARFFALDALPGELAGKLAELLPAYLAAAEAARRGGDHSLSR